MAMMRAWRVAFERRLFGIQFIRLAFFACEPVGLVMVFRTVENGDDHKQIAHKADHRRHNGATLVEDRGFKVRVGAARPAHQNETDDDDEEGNAQKNEIDACEREKRFVLHDKSGCVGGEISRGTESSRRMPM